MDERDKPNLEENIKGIVQDAITNMDFSKLNKDISQTVNSAINEVREGIISSSKAIAAGRQEEKSKNLKKSNVQAKKKEPESIEKRRERKENVIYYSYKKPEPKNKLPQLVTPRPAGRVSGVLMTVFGSIGLTISTILAAGFSIGGLLSPWGGFPFLILVAMFGVAALINIVLIASGNRLRSRVERFQKYVKTLHGRNWCEIEELARVVKKDVKYVARDLRGMIERRFFPQGRLDEEQTCLMLDQTSYEQYMEAKASLEERMRQEEEEARQKNENPEYGRLKEALDEGHAYIVQIRKVNEQIQGEKISQKLYALEGIIQEIFEHLKDNPDKLPEMRRFMNYYLPTTLKLVTTYQELNESEIVGNNITMAKKEIEETLDTINQAFVKLYDSLFEEKAMDISADISVLQTMFKQEGLTDSDFKNH